MNFKFWEKLTRREALLTSAASVIGVAALQSVRANQENSTLYDLDLPEGGVFVNQNGRDYFVDREGNRYGVLKFDSACSISNLEEFVRPNPTGAEEPVWAPDNHVDEKGVCLAWLPKTHAMPDRIAYMNLMLAKRDDLLYFWGLVGIHAPHCLGTFGIVSTSNSLWVTQNHLICS